MYYHLVIFRKYYIVTLVLGFKDSHYVVVVGPHVLYPMTVSNQRFGSTVGALDRDIIQRLSS